MVLEVASCFWGGPFSFGADNFAFSCCRADIWPGSFTSLLDVVLLTSVVGTGRSSSVRDDIF